MSTPNVIKSLQHPLVKHLVKVRTNKRYRAEQGRLVISSGTVVREIARHTPIRTLLLPHDQEVYSGFTPEKIYHVSPEILKKVSGLATPTDCIAEVDFPEPSNLGDCSRLLVLDRLADPGNVGTLARTALALGWDGLFITDQTADPFNDKAVRASRGAVLILPLRQGSAAELQDLLASGFETFIADTDGTPVKSVTPPQKLALVLSSEAHGPDKAIARLGERVTVPMPGEMESLNVAIAGGILTFCLC